MRRRSLVSEAAELLRVGIASRRWVDFLPGERVLAQDLGLSRRILRSALRELELEGLVRRSAQRRRRRINMRKRVRRPADLPPVIAVLSTHGTTGRESSEAHHLIAALRRHAQGRELVLRYAAERSCGYTTGVRAFIPYSANHPSGFPQDP